MKNIPAAELPTQLGDMNDQELRQLVMMWRLEALRGNLDAHTTARVFEVEELSRLQPIASNLQPFLPMPPLQSWWKFW